MRKWQLEDFILLVSSLLILFVILVTLIFSGRTEGAFRTGTATITNLDANTITEDCADSSSMAGNETFTQTGSRHVYFLDPNGADRNFTPSGSFSTGTFITIINKSSLYSVFFDPEGSDQEVPGGWYGYFYYDGTQWR